MNTKLLFRTLFLLTSTLFINNNLLAKAPLPSYTAQFSVFSKNNNQIIYLKNQPQSEIIKMSTVNGSIIKRIPFDPKASNPALIPFAATPDGFKLLAFSPEGIAVIHNGTGKTLRTLPYPARSAPYTYYARSIHRELFIQSDDGVLLSIPNPDNQHIDLIHTGSGKLLHKIDLLNNEAGITDPVLKGIAFNKKRNLIAYEVSSRRNGKTTLQIYDLYKKQNIFNIIIEQPHSNADTLRFSKDQKWILLNNINGKDIKLVDISNSLVKSLPFQYSSFASFIASSDNIVVVQPYEQSYSVWNIRTEKKVTKPLPSQQYGWKVTQSADGSRLALPYQSANFHDVDKLLIINAKSGNVLRQLKGQLY